MLFISHFHFLKNWTILVLFFSTALIYSQEREEIPKKNQTKIEKKQLLNKESNKKEDAKIVPKDKILKDNITRNKAIIQNDFLYHQQELINLQTSNSLRQYDLRFALFHRFLPNLIENNSNSNTQDLGLTRGVSAGIELSFGITDDLDIGSQFTTRNKTTQVWLQYSILKEIEMKNYLYHKAHFLSVAIRAGANNERGQTTSLDASTNESGMTNDGRGKGQGGGNKKNSIFAQLILEKKLTSYMRFYLVPGFTTREHSDFGGDPAISIGAGSYFTPFGYSSPYRFSLEYHLPLMGANKNAHAWGLAAYYVTTRHTFALTLTNTTGTTFDHYILAKAYDEVHFGFQFSRNFSPFL